LHNLYAEERILLKIDLQEMGLGLGRALDCSASEEGQVAGCGECDNKPSGSR